MGLLDRRHRPPAVPEEHPLHDSIWPLVAAGGMFLLAASLLVTLAKGRAGLVLVLLGVLVTLTGSIGWWRQLIQHGEPLPPSQYVARNIRLGMVLFIASEIAFFAAFFIGYFFLRGTSPAWPPPGTPSLGDLRLPMINTMVLLISGLTMTAGHAALRQGNKQGHLLGLAATIALGMVFLIGQGMEWSHAALSIRSGTLGSAFYMLTGFHGMHVLVGVLFLSVILVRSAQGPSSAQLHTADTLAGWYWHFVDAVWILLFISFYLR